MPVPTQLSDLSTTAAINFPQGTDTPSSLDDVQRAHASFIAQIRDGSHVTSAVEKTIPVDADTLSINDSAASNILKKLTWANLKATLAASGIAQFLFGAGSAAAPSISTTGDTNTGIFFPAADTIAFSEGGVERMRINNSGNVGIGVIPTARNNTSLQIVDGIGFPATQVASSDANTLDDYEEGTFTPTIVGTTTAGTGTYTTQTGRYTKIGRMVHVSLSVVWTAHTGTGNIRISGLPFTAVAASTIEWLCVPEFVNMTMPASTTPFAIVQQNSANINIYSQAVGSGTVSQLAMDTAANVYLSIAYEAA